MQIINYIFTEIPKGSFSPTKKTVEIINQYNIAEDYTYLCENASSYKINRSLNLIIRNLQPKNRLIVMTISDLGNTSNKILQRIKTILDKSCCIFIVDENLEISQKDIALMKIISSILHLEDSLKSKRNIAYKKTLQENKRKRGRKSGQKTKSMFDKHKSVIMRLYNQKVPITKILDKLKKEDSTLYYTSSQALGQYIKRVKMIDKKLPNTTYSSDILKSLP
jgi:hypothetical protein